MNWVRQKHQFGCGIACLAMITGKPYDEVCADFGNPDKMSGLHTYAVEVWLAEHGYASSMMPRFARGNRQRTPWPPAPWADAHLVNIQIIGGLHWVVWLRSGEVLDPLKEGVFALSNSSYSDINNIIGVHKTHNPFIK